VPLGKGLHRLLDVETGEVKYFEFIPASEVTHVGF
jgi:hypothetical protein